MTARHASSFDRLKMRLPVVSYGDFLGSSDLTLSLSKGEVACAGNSAVDIGPPI